jgi:protein-L-isoaspartate(D-aspartate) O-methyltransferase
MDCTMSANIAKAKPLIQELQRLGISNTKVLDVMSQIPRELFLPPTLTHKAWENNALPIGQGQTLSQPYTVARMTELLLLHLPVPPPSATVLEIGTGSGYQTTILAHLFGQICSVERINNLKFQAKRRLNHLDCHNVKLRYGDGWAGWASKGPYHAIIVTAAPASVPEALLEQLGEGGCLLLPVGQEQQSLTLYKKEHDTIHKIVIEEAKFVPLVPGELQ